ncbi:MAG TPA: alpha/beta hydrolase, partial [Acidimicrobiales bacterium]|nr:alpha/beta hydrolase [Acidimicrobiales bacterium]
MAEVDFDGRVVHYTTSGQVVPGAPVLVFHHGQPGAALIPPDLAAAAHRHGLEVVMVSRPGYGPSERHAGRRVADAAADTAAVLAHVGAGEFVTAGWSGGGPHALACGALLAPRCAAVAVLAGVAPYHGVPDLDFTAGMGPENAAEFEALIAGDPSLEETIAAQCRHLATITPAGVVDALGGLVSPPDVAALQAGASGHIAASMNLACERGHYGYWDDGIAFISPWGFDLSAITVPV